LPVGATPCSLCCQADGGLKRIAAWLTFPDVTHAIFIDMLRTFRHVQLRSALSAFHNRVETREFGIIATDVLHGSCTPFVALASVSQTFDYSHGYAMGGPCRKGQRGQ